MPAAKTRVRGRSNATPEITKEQEREVTGEAARQTINLMQALRRSLEASERSSAMAEPQRGVRRIADATESEARDDQAQQSMFRDIDAILARLETGIAAERTAIDALLERLISGTPGTQALRTAKLA